MTRTGRAVAFGTIVIVAGFLLAWHDGREFPERAGFDDFFVIELDPEA